MNAVLAVDLIGPAAMVVAGIGLMLFPNLHRARPDQASAMGGKRTWVVALN